MILIKKAAPCTADLVIQGAVCLCSAFVRHGIVVLKRLEQIAELIGGTSVRFFKSVNVAVSRFHLAVTEPFPYGLDINADQQRHCSRSVTECVELLVWKPFAFEELAEYHRR